MAAKYRKFLEFVALLVLAIGIVWWFGRKLDWAQVKSAIAASDCLLLAGDALAGLSRAADEGQLAGNLDCYLCRIRSRAYARPSG
jgi:type IV secretory pathway VirB2 component (pilin)